MARSVESFLRRWALVYIWEYANTDKDTKKSEAIIDEAIATFDALIEKVNAKGVENKKVHFKSIAKELI